MIRLLYVCPVLSHFLLLIESSILANPTALAELQAQHPELAHAAQTNPRRFAELLNQVQMQRHDQQLQRQRQLAALNDDPYDIESQRKIEEMIQQEAIVENLNTAMEYHPESFARVVMLYIDVEVNGHKVKAFVDSGAQATIMSPQCAQACGIMRLVDKRYAGTAVGVGTANILGRVHSAQIKVGSMFLQCSLTVMEGGAAGRAGPDMLFGLDMLKRHQACIDLSMNCLRIGDEAVPFLGEHELPQSAKDEATGASASQTASGPGGAQINDSGAIVDPPKFSGSGHTLGGAAAGPPASTQGSASASSNVVSDDKISQLQAMGFERAECIQALEAADGNVEMAAGLLL